MSLRSEFAVATLHSHCLEVVTVLGWVIWFTVLVRLRVRCGMEMWSTIHTRTIWWLKLGLACYCVDVLGIYVFNNSFFLSFPSVPNFCRNSPRSASICKHLIKGSYFQKSPDFQNALLFPLSSYVVSLLCYI